MEHLQDFYSIIYGQLTSPLHVLNGIVPFWAANKDVWFSHKPIEKWDMIETEYNDTKEDNMSLLLHYDQIYRHPCSKIKESNKPHAYRFATHIALKMIHNEQYGGAEEWEKVFILLTLRHNKSQLLKELMLTKLLQLAEDTPSPLILRFLNASIWDIHSFKHTKGYVAEDCGQAIKYNRDIIAKPIILNDYDISDIYGQIYNAMYDSIKSHDKIAVSISGGVDSMVCAIIAAQICSEYDKKLILLHINYNNRNTCDDECAMLREFARQLRIPLYIRKITEMKRIRNSNLRALYEDVTRRIRFSFYSWFDCPVILGHNLDDCYENVFTNLSKHIHHENLFGMKRESIEQGVTILRPLLKIAKKDIILFADNTGTQHLYDSTPSWSQRGRMRDILIPGITQFDAKILPGLAQFIEYSRFLEQQWQESFNSWINTIDVMEKTIIIPFGTFFNTNYKNLNFWIQLWNILKLDNRPSNKSFNNLIEFIDRNRIHAKCSLNSIWYCKISDKCCELNRCI
jgi:tRNA(Ile)-lysidine synthetase-like protein